MKRLGWLGVTVAALLLACPAHAEKAHVVWDAITMPSAQHRPDLERYLKGVIAKQSRVVDWGSHRDDPIEARIEVTEFSAVTAGGVVRITCAGSGRLTARAGQIARSRFSMGGRPGQRAALERQLLGMLGRGLVTRLADMAKAAH
jgi:hypothetical protein